MSRRRTRPFRKKPGNHGTLYRYTIGYADVSDRDNEGTWRCWAYDAEHALEKFYGAPDADGWKHTTEPKRLRER